MVKLSNNKNLLIGVVYRSPNSSRENNERLLSMLRLAATNRCDYLTVCGDFNFPRIDWNSVQCLEPDGSSSQEFLNVIEELSLFQHARNPTRFRGEQSSCLDLVLTNEENMVDEVGELPPIGKSDHICQKWELTVGEVMFRNTAALRRNFKKANWERIKEDLRNFEGDSCGTPSSFNDKLVAVIDESKSRNVPYCRPRSQKYQLPWMRNAGIKGQRVKKWKSWNKFKRTGLLLDYDSYKFERNRLNKEIRSAKMRYEQGLITDMKSNPNLYHGHCRRSLKTKQGVSNVWDGRGRLTETEEEAAAALNEYYHSVFTNDDPQYSPPVFPPVTHEKLENIILTEESVEDILTVLNPSKAAGPDGVESKLLKECAEEFAPILCTLFRKSMDEGEVPN